ETRGTRGRVNEITPIIKVPMGSRAAGFEMADAFRLSRCAYVKDKKSFGERLALDAAPTRRNALQSRDHFTVRHLNLNGPGIFRPGNKSTELRFGGICDLEHTPTAMPKVSHIEIPAAIHFLHRQLEGRLAVQIMIAERFDILGKISRRNFLRHVIASH